MRHGSHRPNGFFGRRGAARGDGRRGRRLLAVLMAGSTVVAAVALAPHAVSSTERLLASSGSPDSIPASATTTATPKTAGACAGLDFVSARGSGETWDGATDLSTSMETNAVLTGITQVLKAKGVTVPIDVDQLGGPKPYYQAPSINVLTSGLSWNWRNWQADLRQFFQVNLRDYLGAEQDGEAELYSYLTTTYQDCLSTGQEPMVVLAGYSQGAMLVHNVLNVLIASGQTGPAAMIKGAVLIADPERVSFSDVVNLGTASASDEGICPEGEGLAQTFHISLSCTLFGPTTDLTNYFVRSTIAVCDDEDAICDTSADLKSWNLNIKKDIKTDIAELKYGVGVHTKILR